MAQLQCTSEDAREKETVREDYLICVGEKLQESWNVCASVKEKWDILKSTLCDEAED